MDPNRDTARLARNGLIVLSLINLFNYLDRYVVAALTESLKNSPLHPTDAEIGLLGTSFLVVYTLTAPLFGRAGDRGPRARLLGIGVFIWSIATAGAGLVRNMVQLLAARAVVGVGEAAYGTVGPSLLADYYPRERRGRVFAIFFMAIPVGSALGFVVGGLVDHLWGWRSAFFVAGGPGLVLAFLAARLWDAPRGAHDGAKAEASGGGDFWHTLRQLASNRPYVVTVLGYAAYTSPWAAWPTGWRDFWSGSGTSRRPRPRRASEASWSSPGWLAQRWVDGSGTGGSAERPMPTSGCPGSPRCSPRHSSPSRW